MKARDSVRKLLWFEINKSDDCVIYCNFQHTFVPYGGCRPQVIQTLQTKHQCSKLCMPIILTQFNKTRNKAGLQQFLLGLASFHSA